MKIRITAGFGLSYYKKMNDDTETLTRTFKESKGLLVKKRVVAN